MKANYQGTMISIEQAASKVLNQTDYYSRGSEAVAEKVQNLIDLNAKLIRILVDNKILDVEAAQDLLNMSVED